MSNRLVGGIIGCKYKTFSWHLNGFSYGSNINWVKSIISGRNPPVILYTYINRHAGTPEKQRRPNSTSSNLIIYNNSLKKKQNCCC